MFEGICVGGPRAGHRVAAVCRTVSFPHTPGLAALLSTPEHERRKLAEAYGLAPPTSEALYEWTEIDIGHGRLFGYFRFNELSDFDALAQVFATYVEVSHALKRRASTEPPQR